MSNHYFSTRPQVGSRPKQIRARLRGREWTFLSDRGVFARGGVDAGTRLLVETMRIARADHILDIGCGYGPVGLVAAWLAPAGQAVLVDVNERAVMLAAQNARLNGLVNVEVLQGDGCGPVAGRFFDAAVTNPPIRAGKATLRRLVREVRLALLEADVNFKVAKAFVDRVRAAAVGQQVLTHLAPGQQVVKLVYEELVRLLGGTTRALRFADRPPTVILLVGLHGAGKTTTAGKLAMRLRNGGRRPLLVATDLRRPAAIAQLQVVGQQAGVLVFSLPGATDPVAVATAAVGEATQTGHDVVIIDSAGRQQIDDELMAELVTMREATSPHQVLLGLDAMTGQEAVNIAQRFDELLRIDGLIVTKLDGDARGGAVLSVVEVTGRPVLFAGVGEKLDGLEPFHPDRMASRILGMGDVLTLIEKAQGAVDAETAADLERKLRRGEVTLYQFRAQLRPVRTH